MPHPYQDEQEEDQEEERPTSSRRRSRGVNGVMQSSGQTDAERRVLRSNQRNLAKKIVEEGHEIEDVKSGKYDEIRGKNNELFEDVCYTREAVLDSVNMEMISGRAVRQVDRLVQVPRYDANRLAQKLRTRCSTNNIFDWQTLGLQAGSCFNAIPSRITILNGPIQTASTYKPKERKKIERRKQQEDDVEEEEPEEVVQKTKNKTDGDKLSAVENQMKDMSKMLKKRCSSSRKRSIEAVEKEMGVTLEEMDHEEKKSAMKKIKSVEPEKICAVKFLFNPKSFTQTVENVFAMSFMVRKGQAAIGVRTVEDCKNASIDSMKPKPGPWIRNKKDKDENVAVEHRQSILSLNMQDWRDMCAAYAVSEGDLPHRTGSAHKKSN